MKKTLAILLTLILTFSCFSILGIGTVSAAENDGVLLELDLSDSTKWSGNRISMLDDDGDGTKETIRLNNTTGSSNLNSSTFVLTPGKEYKLSFEIRIPAESIDFADYLLDGTLTKTNPKFAIFQPGNTAAGEKIAEGYGEGKNDYSYKYEKYGTVRRPTFSADWQVGSYSAITVGGVSGFNTQFYNLLKDDSGNVISPNVAFANWTTITSTFTAIDDEENGAVGDQVAALNFTIASGKKGPGLMYDIKNVKLIDVAAQPEPETQKTILTSDFGSDTNWTIRGHVSYTDENSDGVKDFARLKPLSTAVAALRSAPVQIVPGEEYELTFLARIPEESKEFQTDTYKIYPEFIMYQPTLTEDGTKVANNYGEGTNDYAYKGNGETTILRRADFVSTWQIGDFDPIARNRYSSFSDSLYATACPDTTIDEAYNGWTKVTYKFTGLASAENDGPETVAFYFYISKNANADGCFFDIKDVKLIENPNAAPETPEEPEVPEVPVLRGPEVDEGFEDFTADTKLYDNKLTGTQNMYTYTSKGKLLTGFGDLTVSNQGGYNGSKQSLTGRTYYQYAAMPLALDVNTEYELSFWYLYSTTNADVYLKELFYGIVKPTEGSSVNESILHGGGGTLRMKEYFAPGEFDTNKWRKATLKFSTGDNVDGLVFAYSYSDGLKSDITATVNKTPLYIDDVKIKKVENAPEKVNITVSHKDAASVEITSGYFKDFIVGEKIQFKVRTKDALVPTVTVNGNAIAENNGYYTYTITESDVAIKVECEGDENRGDPNNYNGLPLYEYNQEVAVTPVWEGNVVYHETALFTTGRETAKLLYPIDKVVAVRSYDLTKIYFEGVDYEIAEDGTLRILEGSQIPVYKGALETDKESSFKFADKENAYAHFVDNYEYAAYAVNVTYEHSDVWTGDEGYNPEAVQSVADKIPGVIEKLEKGEDVEVVILGDSLSTGSSTSGQAYDDLYNDKGGQNINALNYAPFTPSWPVMLEQTLKTLYPDANITFKNIAHGGKTAKWGSERLLTRLGYLERDFGWTYETPDLLILAYGGNDLTAGYTAEQFKGYMQSIITQYRGYKQDDNAEVLLWTETRHHTQVTQYTKENHEAYQNAYYELVEENGSVGLVDTLNVFNEVVQSKPETDLFSDCVIHVNDFATRVIVQSFVAALTKPKYLAGDINGDEVNNLKDLIVLAQYVAGWENLDVVEDILDVNLDGTVNLLDVTNLAKHLAGWKDVTVNGSFF